jgi:hypothetical protein
MGGAKIEENMLIDKTIHKAIDARSAVLKVYKFPGTGLPFLVCYLILKLSDEWS